VFVESVGAHGLLAFAEGGHGIAVIPSILQDERMPLRFLRVTYRRQPLRILLAVVWHRGRMQSGYANCFGELVAKHVRETFPHP
jgi:DNA-binding transcriptional LysR family regulator